MIDTGSELNLMSQDFYVKTNLAVNLDGTRWSLKGINGRPVPLGGCIRNTEIKISGRRFDHHIFISREGTGKQEIILGQPWLQAVLYTPTAFPTDSNGLLSDPAISNRSSGQSVGIHRK